jgi:hypothetical protein
MCVRVYKFTACVHMHVFIHTYYVQNMHRYVFHTSPPQYAQSSLPKSHTLSPNLPSLPQPLQYVIHSCIQYVIHSCVQYVKFTHACFRSSGLGMGFPKNSPLIDPWNVAIQKAFQTGAVVRLKERYKIRQADFQCAEIDTR